MGSLPKQCPAIRVINRRVGLVYDLSQMSGNNVGGTSVH